MRNQRSEGGGYMCSAVRTTGTSGGPACSAVSQHKAVADPFPAKTKDRQNDDREEKFPTPSQSLSPHKTSTPILEDPTIARTFSPNDIDSWRKSVALRHSTISTTSVASTILHEPTSPRQSNATYSIDIEKQSLHASSRFSQQTRAIGVVERGGAVYTSYREPLVDGCEAKDHTPWILLYLSFLSPPLTLAISLYTLFMLFILLLLSPLSFCTKRKSLRQQIGSYLLPPLDYQFYCLYHTSPSEVDLCNGSSTTIREHHSLWLITISLISPLYSFAIAFAVWVAASFWIYAGILGDPNGSGQNDNDGPRAVLRVRKWWCEWLGRSIMM